jgi:hypothetical protein
MNRDHDHDIADMLVRERNSKTTMLQKAVREHNRMRELLEHMLYVTEDEGQIDNEDFKKVVDFIEKTFPVIEVLDHKPEVTNHADFHGDTVPEDRHSELFRARQNLVGRKDCVGGPERHITRDARQASRLAYPVSESCPCFTCREAREADEPCDGSGCNC